MSRYTLTTFGSDSDVTTSSGDGLVKRTGGRTLDNDFRVGHFKTVYTSREGTLVQESVTQELISGPSPES